MKKALTITLLILAFKLISCARIGSPSGGAKDSIPPVMAIARPMNKTTSFKNKKIVILFDEYIKFEKLNSQLILSPPMEKKPMIKPQSGASKKISIEFQDSLAPNTTYTLNFGNSIVDHNEGNQLGRFSYVFSTGTELDSLSVIGKVNDLLMDEEVNNISIMAYKNANDTLVGNYIPNYLTNTLKSNVFSLENLSEASYKLIALEDKNNNYKYDKGFEKIGFIDKAIYLQKPMDSIQFLLFKEFKNNKIYRPRQVSGNHLVIGYTGETKPSIKIAGTSNYNYLISKEVGKDSLNIWFKEMPADSVYISVKQDTLFEQFSYKVKELKKDSLLIESLVKGVLHPNDSLSITSNIPVMSINNDSIQLLENDSIAVPFKVLLNNKKHKLTFDFKRKEKKTYKLLLKDHALTDVFENKNKAESINLTTLDAEEYGEIVLEIKNPNSINLIIKLIELGTKKISLSNFNKSGKVSFKKLPPQKYKIQIIKDLNKNNKFDNGNFRFKTQPEPIINLKKTIILRANSEINEIISID